MKFRKFREVEKKDTMIFNVTDEEKEIRLRHALRMTKSVKALRTISAGAATILEGPDAATLHAFVNFVNIR